MKKILLLFLFISGTVYGEVINLDCDGSRIYTITTPPNSLINKVYIDNKDLDRVDKVYGWIYKLQNFKLTNHSIEFEESMKSTTSDANHYTITTHKFNRMSGVLNIRMVTTFFDSGKSTINHYGPINCFSLRPKF
jgi:hypothetical protein